MMHLKQLVEEQVQKVALLIQLACLFTNGERVKYQRNGDMRMVPALKKIQRMGWLVLHVFGLLS